MQMTQLVQIYAFDDSLVKTTPFQLLQWKHAMQLEISSGLTMKGGRKVSTHLRKLLKTPKNYPVSDLLAHVRNSLKDIEHQFGTGEFNLEYSE